MGYTFGGGKMEYEKCENEVWIDGTIKDLQERLNTKKFKNPAGEYEDKEVDEMRFVFDLEDYRFNHYSRWMTKSTAERSALYDKYLKQLVPDLSPFSRVNLERLIGKKVKVMWTTEKGKDGNDYQVVLKIKPVDTIMAEDLNPGLSEKDNKEKLPF